LQGAVNRTLQDFAIHARELMDSEKRRLRRRRK
jgi:hypothetical protein